MFDNWYYYKIVETLKKIYSNVYYEDYIKQEKRGFSPLVSRY